MMDLTKSILISAAGMRAQGTRMRVVAENLANMNSIATTPGGDPYQRKFVTFGSELDKATGLMKVHVEDIERDQSDFRLRHDPSHPGADAAGYVKLPNVLMLVEMMDMREAQRSYEANVNVIDVTKSMIKRTVDLLKS